jgi:glutathione S-transferase
MTLKIYGTPRSNTIRPLWLVHELEIEYELVEVPLGAEGSRKPDYRSLNPNGRAPCIVRAGASRALCAPLGT